MSKIKIISVSSLAAHRTASLKAQLAILGSSLLPVPTVVLNGVASYAMVKKQAIDFMPLLEGTLQLCAEQNQIPYLFVGYLTNAKDALQLKEFILTNRHLLAGVFVDPISGDNDKPYIHSDIIKVWPHLLSVADFAFPNLTELKLYSGLPFEAGLLEHADAFETKYPQLKYIIKSYTEKRKFGVRLKTDDDITFLPHKHINVRYDGTGDVFAAFFMKYHIISKKSYPQSCKKAIRKTIRLIEKALKDENSELEIIK